MKHSFRGLPVGNPLANLLIIIVGSLAIIASLVLGFFAFVAVAAILLVAVAYVRIRLWWLARRGGPTQQPDGGVIEGEFKVVADDREGE